MGAVDYGNNDTKFDEADFTDSQLVHHVRDALNLVKRGDTDNYNQLVAVLHYRPPLKPEAVALLVTSLKALTGSVRCLDNVHHHSLLTSIFSMSLWSYEPDVTDALLELITLLAATKGEYRDSCLNMLVHNFTPPHSFINVVNQPRGISRKNQVLSQVHLTLNVIIDLAPLTPMKLLPKIIESMPKVIYREKLYTPQEKMTFTFYVENMLRLEKSSFGELFRSTILSGVVDLLRDLDLQIGCGDTSLDYSYKGIFKMELEDDELKECSNDELLRELGPQSKAASHRCAEILDSLMEVTFEHLKTCQVNGRLIEVFETLLQSFQKTVMTAYRSKFSQFVMFYACALDPENCGSRFATMLTDTFASDHPPPLRMSAVAYLASYLSRAKFLSSISVINTLERLVNWCLDYCKLQKGKIDPKVHGVFYSGCQAIMYVLCFRLRSTMTIPLFKAQLYALNIILSHKLNPLKICLHTVVIEFLQQAKAARLFTTSDKFKFDNYLSSEVVIDFKDRERERLLDMFFPFDPYLLKNSERFIRPNFVDWSMVNGQIHL